MHPFTALLMGAKVDGSVWSFAAKSYQIVQTGAESEVVRIEVL